MGSDRPRRPTHPPGISHGCKARLQRLRPAPEDVVDGAGQASRPA